ncbi:Pyridoxine/pyridoxamine 5'-phosphate oxidase 1, chloroplastic [Galdieria sulphuraria]|nr:Pyridoxine/pyridoxamine 5'-phosphate oxidase 1, chloroplastic [Galdieria sulphuraria]
MSSSASSTLSYLSQEQATKVDQLLMGPEYSFAVEQLMELAGLAVALAVAEQYPLSSSGRSHILCVCGPGNNGGDGLVAARHLFHFGYQVSILYPKRTEKSLFGSLVKQLEALDIPILSAWEQAKKPDVIIDAIFGFSFRVDPSKSSKEAIRPPFFDIIQSIKASNAQKVSVDIPSGWDVNEGDIYHVGFIPDMLVSLTAPKQCALSFSGMHYVGGRFIPPKLAQELGFVAPQFEGTKLVKRIQ